MHTPLLIGSLAFFAAATLWLGFFFLRVWLARREDREYLAFGALCASFAAHAVLTALAFAQSVHLTTWPSQAMLFAALVVPTKLATAFTFHFTLLYAHVKRADAIAVPVYVLMGAFSILGIGGGWWQVIGDPVQAEIFGLSLYRPNLVPTAAARPFYLLVPVLLAGCIYLFGRSYWRTRRGLGAWVSSMLFGAAVINDLGVGAGWLRSVPLFAVGFLVFTYGVALTLLSRYAQTTNDLKAKTESLRLRSRELESSYAELRRTQQELVRSEQLAVIGELAAVIAHEVRNPLAIVGNAVASLRKRHTTRDDRRMLLEIINEEMGRLDKLVGRLIHYARPVVLARESVAVADVVALASKVLEGTDVRLDLEPSRDIPEVTGDSELLRQVFENLLSNASQALHGAGSVRVRFARRNVGGVPVLAVDVEDDGEGMAQEQVESALTPFFTTRPTGTGLGLPIVSRIVDAHGGQVQLATELGEGTTVTVLLPLSPDKPLRTALDKKSKQSPLP